MATDEDQREDSGDEQQSLFWPNPNLYESPDSEDMVFKKHRAIIHRTHGRTVMEEKIFSGLLIAAKVAMRMGQSPKDGFTISERYLKSFSGIKTKSRDHLVATIDVLQSRTWKFDFFDLEEKFKELRVFSPISEARFLPNGEILFFLPPTLQEVLLNPDIYAVIDSRITNLLQSVYSMALYELAQGHMDREMVFKTILEFRTYMGLKPSEYGNFSDMRRHVIDKACDEINLKTDTRVEYDFLKEGKKRVGIKFQFTRVSAPLDVPSDSDQLDIVVDISARLPHELRGVPWVVQLLSQYVNERGVEWVNSNVDAFLDRISSKVGAPVKSVGAMFRTAFKDDFGKSFRDAKKVQDKLNERQSATDSVQASKLEEARIEEERIDKANELFKLEVKKYNEYFDHMPAAVQSTIRKEIIKTKIAGPEDIKICQYLKDEMQIKL